MRGFALVIALAILAGCTSEQGPPHPDGVTLVFGEGDPGAFDPSAALDDLAGADVQLREDQQAIIDTIAAHPQRFLAGGPTTAVLNEAELVFLGAGRIYELAGWMVDAVEGGDTGWRPRAAWTLERAGLHTKALRYAEIAVEEHPDDAEAWFVLGYILGQADDADEDTLRRVGEAFEEAIDLDPDFAGPGNVRAPELRRQVREINASLRLREPSTPPPHPNTQ